MSFSFPEHNNFSEFFLAKAGPQTFLVEETTFKS